MIHLIAAKVIFCFRDDEKEPASEACWKTGTNVSVDFVHTRTGASVLSYCGVTLRKRKRHGKGTHDAVGRVIADYNSCDI